MNVLYEIEDGALGWRKLCALLIHRAGGHVDITADELQAFDNVIHTEQRICIGRGYPDNDVIRIELTD